MASFGRHTVGRAFLFLGPAMKLTDRHVSEEALDIMIDWMERTQAYQALDALLELKQRRAEDRKRGNDGK